MALVVRQTMLGLAWVAQPERALSPAQGRCLLLAAAAVCGGIAAAFAAVGAWPVLPFAGVEIAVLWAALRHLRRHADDEERIDVGERQVVVSRRSGGRDERHEFIRHWVRLRVDAQPGRGDCRLFLRSHGREVEIGRLLTDAQKRALAGELGTRLGAAPR
ncbi:MAG: DUF2244 domain-containing protein [Rhodocyclaceae bacterium]|nr:DUF2244 domain-containing protein [Rhodocyclaceae bacterium]